MSITITQERINQVLAHIKKGQGSMTRAKLEVSMSLSRFSIDTLIKHCLTEKMIVEHADSVREKSSGPKRSTLAIRHDKEYPNRFEGWGGAPMLGMGRPA